MIFEIFIKYNYSKIATQLSLVIIVSSRSWTLLSLLKYRLQELIKKHSGKGERSVEESAKIVGLKLPHEPRTPTWIFIVKKVSKNIQFLCRLLFDITNSIQICYELVLGHTDQAL